MCRMWITMTPGAQLLHRHPGLPGRVGRPSRRLRKTTRCCSQQDDAPYWWHRHAAAAASLTLSLQACLAPCSALELQQPALVAEAAASSLASLPELHLAERLPPMPTEFPPLPPISMAKYEELTLPNGLRVFLVEDHEVPAVRGTLVMRGGQRASPTDKVGLATISAGVQRAGGSIAHPESVLDEQLEDRGASIEGGASADAISLGFQCLSEDTRDVLGLFAEVALSPALPEPKVELYKAQIKFILEHKNDNPRSIPGRELGQLIYGKDSVFARSPTMKQVMGIGVEDVRQFLATWERPDTSVLGLVGDFNSQQMKSSVAVGEVGIALLDPDDYPLDLLNDVLNSFGGRLFDEIRSREGLAYSVQGGWASTPVDHPGLFLATAETAQPGQLLAALRKALQAATETPPTEEEVARAKDESLNQFVFNFSSPAAQLQRLVNYSVLGIPRDYLFKYQEGIQRVTPAQVLAAAQRHLHPAQQTAVVAGDASKIRAELEAAGWVVEDLRLNEE